MKKIVLVVSLLLLFAAFGGTTAFAAEGDTSSEGEIVYVLDSCDDATNFSTSTIADHRNYVEGTGSVYSNNEAGRVTAIFPNVDSSQFPAFEEAYLEFYYYITDIENVVSGEIELNSSGYEDVNEINYSIGRSTQGLGTGWNFISLKLTDFNRSGNFVYEDLMGFRVFMLGANGSMQVRVDNIVLTNVSHMKDVQETGITVLGTPQISMPQKVSDSVIEVPESGSGPAAWVAWVLGTVAVILAAGATVLFIASRREKK